MKNFVQNGETLTLTSPGSIASGDGALVGTIFGVAHGSADVGGELVVMTKGVFDMSALPAAAAGEGVAAYWDDTNKLVTPQASGNTLIGSFSRAKVAGEATAQVWLKP